MDGVIFYWHQIPPLIPETKLLTRLLDLVAMCEPWKCPSNNVIHVLHKRITCHVQQLLR
jgi:hypothetical protein